MTGFLRVVVAGRGLLLGRLYFFLRCITGGGPLSYHRVDVSYADNTTSLLESSMARSWEPAKADEADQAREAEEEKKRQIEDAKRGP